MSCLHHFVAVLPLLACGGPDQFQGEVRYEEPRRHVVVERPGLPPVIIGGSDEILARDDLKGTWQVVSLEHQGAPRPDLAPDLQMRFSRGRLELMQTGRETIVVAYNLEIDQYPRPLNWFLRRHGSILLQKGVYWQEGDTMMVCMGPINQRRATEFLTQPDDGRVLFVLERVKPREEDVSRTDGQWMVLGVYALAKGDQPGASLLVRLALSREGTIVGESYDPVTKSKQPLRGSVDTQAGQAVWTVGTDKGPVMTTSLDGLTQAESAVLVRDAEGRSETWTMTAVFPPTG